MRLKNKLLVSSLGIIGLPAIMSASMILSSTDNIKLNASKSPLQTKQLKDKQSTTNNFINSIKSQNRPSYDLLQNDNPKLTKNGLAGLEHANNEGMSQAIADAQSKITSKTYSTWFGCKDDDLVKTTGGDHNWSSKTVHLEGQLIFPHFADAEGYATVDWNQPINAVPLYATVSTHADYQGGRWSLWRANKSFEDTTTQVGNFIKWRDNYKAQFQKNIGATSLENYSFHWNNTIVNDLGFYSGWWNYITLHGFHINFTQPTITYKNSTENQAIIAKPILLSEAKGDSLNNNNPQDITWFKNHLILMDENKKLINFNPDSIRNINFHPDGNKKIDQHDRITFEMSNTSKQFQVDTETFNLHDMFQLSTDTSNSYGIKSKDNIYNHYDASNLPSLKLQFNEQYLNALMAEKNGENLFDKIQRNISTVAFPNWSLDSLTVAGYTKLAPNPNIPTSVVNKDKLGGINSSNVDEFIKEYKQHGQLGNWFNSETTWNNAQNRAGKYQPPSWSGYYNDNDNDDWNQPQPKENNNYDLDQYSLSVFQTLFNQPNAKLSLTLTDATTGQNINENININNILNPKTPSNNNTSNLTWNNATKDLNINVPSNWYTSESQDKKLWNLQVSNLSFTNESTTSLKTNLKTTSNFNNNNDLTSSISNIPFDFNSNLNKDNILMNDNNELHNSIDWPTTSDIMNEASSKATWKINSNLQIQNNKNVNPAKEIQNNKNISAKSVGIWFGIITAIVFTLGIAGFGIYKRNKKL